MDDRSETERDKPISSETNAGMHAMLSTWMAGCMYNDWAGGEC